MYLFAVVIDGYESGSEYARKLSPLVIVASRFPLVSTMFYSNVFISRCLPRRCWFQIC